MHRRSIAPLLVLSALALPTSLGYAWTTPDSSTTSCTSTGYREVDAVSSVSGRADVTDASLVNPWGLAFNPSGPLWVANNGTSTSEAISATGTSLLNVAVPTTGEGPTGIVFYGGSDGFRVTSNGVSAPA